MKDTRTKPSACPGCGKVLDMARDPDSNHSPSEGDLTVCMSCLSVLRFGQDMLLTLVTPEELMDFSADDRDEIVYIQSKILQEKLHNEYHR